MKITLKDGDRLSLKIAAGPLWVVGPGIEQRVEMPNGEWTICSTREYDALRLRVQMAAWQEAGDGERVAWLSGVDGDVRPVQADDPGRAFEAHVGERDVRRDVPPVRPADGASVSTYLGCGFCLGVVTGLAALALIRWVFG